MDFYKYETHCHTACCSACSKMSAQNIIDLYKRLGYQGVFITDHFINSSTTIPQDLPWEERIHLFANGYKEVKELGEKAGLDIFFGFEASYHGTHFLVYGLDEQWLCDHEECFTWKPSRMLEFFRAEGGFVIQAHPYRDAKFIDHIRIFYKNVDGIEVFNSSRDDRCNRLAKNFAEEYSMIQTAGSDIHHVQQPIITGMIFPRKILNIADYRNMLANGEGKIIL